MILKFKFQIGNSFNSMCVSMLEFPTLSVITLAWLSGDELGLHFLSLFYLPTLSFLPVLLLKEICVEPKVTFEFTCACGTSEK